MKAISIFLLFIGMFLVVQGFYSQTSQCPRPEVQIKYIPRSLYEEQLSDKQKLQVQFKSLFEDVSPWLQLKE
jgi:hypothetical protein